MGIDSRKIVVGALFLVGLGCSTPQKDARTPTNDEMPGPFFHERSDTSVKDDATVGRYLYLGDVPRFEASALEFFVSKMSLTMRVQAWVSPAQKAGYGRALAKRWSKVYEAMQSSKFQPYRLKAFATAIKTTKNRGDLLFYKIAQQYATHVLENHGVSVFNHAISERQYRDNISIALGRYYFKNETMTLDDMVRQTTTPDGLADLDTRSVALFDAHFGQQLIPSTAKAGFVGYINFVYPIAGVTEGPFDQPTERTRLLGIPGNMNARWWSEKWDDQYGGFPFVMINSAGVAFHGPITTYPNDDVWFLRRDYVSHGCFRMDSSDVLEVRNMLPYAMDSLVSKKMGIPINIFNYLDIADVNGDGKVEAVDVAYYDVPMYPSVPKGKTTDQALLAYKPNTAKWTFWKKMVGPHVKLDTKSGTVLNPPKYSKLKGSFTRTGSFSGAIPIHTFPYKGNSILQYTETGMQWNGFEDQFGAFPPRFFIR